MGKHGDPGVSQDAKLAPGFFKGNMDHQVSELCISQWRGIGTPILAGDKLSSISTFGLDAAQNFPQS